MIRRSLLVLLWIGFVSLLSSCEEEFLEKPNTSGTVDLNEVYSSAINARNALMNCYRSVLVQGWPSGIGIGHGALASISGIHSKGYNWHGTWVISDSGLSPNPLDGNDSGGADNFGNNWNVIRKCFLVKENIDMVPDMDENTKTIIKAECTGLIAYRYMGMFYRYGGVPIVTKSLTSNDDLNIARASLQETLDYTLQLCEEAIAGLPSEWPADQTGRLTKGAVMAMKARVLMYAARPLFNSTTPYLSYDHNELISFGTADQDRWQDAISANEKVLEWAQLNGFELINSGGSSGEPNPNAFKDYATATSTPGNKEVILAYKYDETNQWNNYLSYYLNYSPYWTANRWDTDNLGLLSNFLSNYYREDGTDQSWPQVGDDAARPASDWLARIDAMEPRFEADHIGPGFDAANNPGDFNYSVEGWGRSLGNYGAQFPSGSGFGKGSGFSVKFFYQAGSRTWFEPPLFRLAETYLNLAEAYNEVGNSSQALSNLNVVHNRAGLPAITETNQGALRKIIQREKAIEFYMENQRYYDVKHWMLEDIGDGIIGGQMREMQFEVEPTASNKNLASSLIYYWDSNAYIAYWNPKMFLEPIPQSEVNKGIIVQNPGY